MVGDSRYPLNGRDGSLCLPFRTNASICTLFSGHVLPSLVFILESFLERDSKTEHLRRECRLVIQVPPLHTVGLQQPSLPFAVPVH